MEGLLNGRFLSTLASLWSDLCFRSCSECMEGEASPVNGNTFEGHRIRSSLRHGEIMDDTEIDRLRKAICRSFNSSPHKKKYWLALLDMQVAAEESEQPGIRKASKESEVLGLSVMSEGGKLLI
jgi:hypothetical protein